MKRVAVLLLALGAIAVAAAGCGGGGGGETLSKDEYQSKMQELGKDLSSAANSLGDVNPSDLSSATQVFDKAADLFDKAADGLAKINAPKEIADAHEQLVDGAREAAKEFRDLGQKIKNAKLTDLPKLLQGVNPENFEGFKKIQKAVDEIKASGYEIGSAG